VKKPVKKVEKAVKVSVRSQLFSLAYIIAVSLLLGTAARQLAIVLVRLHPSASYHPSLVWRGSSLENMSADLGRRKQRLRPSLRQQRRLSRRSEQPSPQVCRYDFVLDPVFLDFCVVPDCHFHFIFALLFPFLRMDAVIHDWAPGLWAPGLSVCCLGMVHGQCLYVAGIL